MRVKQKNYDVWLQCFLDATYKTWAFLIARRMTYVFVKRSLERNKYIG